METCVVSRPQDQKKDLSQLNWPFYCVTSYLTEKTE